VLHEHARAVHQRKVVWRGGVEGTLDIVHLNTNISLSCINTCKQSVVKYTWTPISLSLSLSLT
jgi:hypothetical protein